ncbi:2oxoglutarate dehydrogenase [Seminavis robusta]|uniref:2oxoglutarate dehydrogenase n=1 Tax=Seminavis robusta TaxID=568900 RepID=A0A9N8HHV6_9STRA|nr:2oxoglutarate dehydrogenase [Seminavis robusta]|eukprot:Sro585_g171100.1 2oxoglutarate dehydrogenase (472) ;mRNA; r:55792-57207
MESPGIISMNGVEADETEKTWFAEDGYEELVTKPQILLDRRTTTRSESLSSETTDKRDELDIVETNDFGDSAGKEPEGKADSTNDQRGMVRQTQRWLFRLLIGALAVSFWRGLWSLFDVYSCDQPVDASLLNGEIFCGANDLENPMRRNSALLSLVVGISLCCLGELLYLNGFFQESKVEELSETDVLSRTRLAVTRIFMVQAVGSGNVLTWRGVWMLTEVWLYPKHLLRSNWISACLGCAGALVLDCSASLLAPPTVLLQDPSTVVFDTIFSVSRRSRGFQRESHGPWSNVLSALDLFGTFVVLPILEVWFWRGIWTLQDFYFWGYSSSGSDLNWSLAVGMIIFCASVLVSSWAGILLDGKTQPNNSLVHHITVRTQNVLLGIASVSYWRVVWYLWEIGSGSTAASSWASHVLGATGLLMLGCLSSAVVPVSWSTEEEDSNEVSEPDDSDFLPRWFAIAHVPNPRNVASV